MRNNKFIRFTRNFFPLLLLGSVLFTFPFFGTECGVIINGQLNTLDKVLGTWYLYRQTGYLMDICPDETVIFGTDYYAILLCPGKDSVKEKFVINNQFNTITYDRTKVVYEYETHKDSLFSYLDLYGVNVGRNLFYRKPVSLDYIGKTELPVNNNNTLNSSELK